jgi:hypothetical protein
LLSRLIEVQKSRPWKLIPQDESPRPVFLVMLLDSVVAVSGTEDQRDAPNARQTNHRVDDAAEQRGRSAADPRYQVKLEKPDASPVQRADNGQNERNSIHDHSFFLLFSACSADISMPLAFRKYARIFIAFF